MTGAEATGTEAARGEAPGTRGTGNEGTGNEVAGTDPVRVLPAGRHGLLVELPTGAAAEAFHAELLRRRGLGSLPAVREIVPGARTVLLDGIADGSPGAPERLARALGSWRIPPLPRDAGPAVEVPVVYDGPDLADVAALWGVGPGDVARIHSGIEFRVAFSGFAPGFGYLTGLPEHFQVPRRTTPRTRVPAGSLALAGPYTGVYPRASPGGWQLIGRTPDPECLWNQDRDPAALLTPGTRVRFMETPERHRAAGTRTGEAAP